jgi:AraC-like DNA-binding protein
MTAIKYPERLVFDKDWLKMPLISSGGYHLIRKPIELESHAHNSFELTYISEGEVTWKLENERSILLSGGKAAIMQPKTYHRGEWNIIKPCRLFWIVFQPSAKNAELHTPFTVGQLKKMEKELKNAGNAIREVSTRFAALCEDLLTALIRRKENKEDYLSLADNRALICQIALETTRLFTQKNNDQKVSKLAEKTMDYIMENIHVDIGVPELAEEFGLSSASSNKHFKAETGQTPADFIRRVKCSEAENLLSKSNKSITEIAFSLGFSSSQYFASVFKKYTGMTPGKFKGATGRHRK